MPPTPRTPRTRWSLWPRAVCTVGVALALLATGCKRRDEPATRRVVVFAAASLHDAFSTLGQRFQDTHPGVEVVFSFAGTQELRRQLEQGARADVFASADTTHMDALTAAGVTQTPAVVAHGRLVVVLAPGTSLPGLDALPTVERLVVGGPTVPVGRYTQAFLDRADARFGAGWAGRVRARVASEELNVSHVLAKVRLGEADAGVVYRTDALTAPELGVLPIPDALAPRADYPVAVLTEAAEPALAAAFVALVRSTEGQAVLGHAGFDAAAP